MNIYFAGPLFTLAERRFNEELAAEIGRRMPAADIFLPQVCDHALEGKPDFASKLYRILIDAVDRCDVIVAILDGPDSDSGTCIEIAYAHAKGKPVIGVRTDFRDGEIHGLNVMTAGICTALIKLPANTCTIDQLAEKVVEELNCCRGSGFPG
jgi:nucleoside 2-deoxyribosyltransferase